MDEQQAALLVNGYVRTAGNKLILFMPIPRAILAMIYQFYPRIRRISDDSYNKNQFLLSNNGTLIQGIGCCSSYLIYAQSDDGYRKGVHLWSVKALIKPNCYRYIGVINQKHDHFITQSNVRVSDTCCYLYPRKSEFWPAETTVTVKLDCNDWIVSFYHDNELKKQYTMEQDQPYYFVMKLCAAEKFTSLQCVEPSIRIKIE